MNFPRVWDLYWKTLSLNDFPTRVVSVLKDFKFVWVYPVCVGPVLEDFEFEWLSSVCGPCTRGLWDFRYFPWLWSPVLEKIRNFKFIVCVWTSASFLVAGKTKNFKIRRFRALKIARKVMIHLKMTLKENRLNFEKRKFRIWRIWLLQVYFRQLSPFEPSELPWRGT